MKSISKEFLLKQGDRICPCCMKPLMWEQIYGIRLRQNAIIKETNEKINVYEAKCSECNNTYWVISDKADWVMNNED